MGPVERQNIPTLKFSRPAVRFLLLMKKIRLKHGKKASVLASSGKRLMMPFTF
jgi:hypothetical protein